MNLEQMRKRRVAIATRMRAIADGDITDELRTEFDALTAEDDKLAEDIRRLERLEANERDLATPQDPPTRIEMGDAPQDRGFENFGEFLRSVRMAGVAGGRVDERLIEERVSGASEGVASAGGFLVGQDFASELTRMALEESNLLSRCRRIPISGTSNRLTINVIDETSRATGSRWGGVQIYRKPEGVAATAKRPVYAQMEWKLKKLIALSYATDELEADASAHAAIVQRAFAEEFAFVIDDEIFRGEGGSEMLGFTNSDCFVSQTIETGQEPDTVVFENLIKMYARFAGRNGVWLANRNVFPQLATMTLDVGTGGNPVYLPPAGAAAAPYGTILGLPLIFTEQSPTVGDANDICLVDLGQYIVIEKGGLVGAVSMHVKFAEDEMAYRWTLRNDGQPLWKSAVTPYEGGSSWTRSPFVGLAERA